MEKHHGRCFNHSRTSQLHNQGHVIGHSSSLEDGDSNAFKKKEWKVKYPIFMGKILLGSKPGLKSF